MKRIYQFLALTGFLILPAIGFSQVFMSEDFNAGAPTGWNATGLYLSTSTNTCGSQAYFRNIYFTATNEVTTATATADGGDINISFDYKIIDYSGGGATSGDWGTLTLEHTTDGGGTWVTDTVIDQTNHVPSTSCATVNTVTTAVEVPAASTVQWRFTVVYANGDYYFTLDNVNIIEVVSCPAPTALTTTANDLTSATFSWGAGSEPEWEIEYGPVGFTPGTGAGTTVIVNSNPGGLSSLPSNMFYEAYVRAICSPGDTSGYNGPALFNTYNQPLYMASDNDCGPTFNDISGTGTATGLADDAEVGVALPFTLVFQGTPVNDITIAENGGILLGTQAGNLGFGNGTIAGADDGIYGFWDDLQNNYGDIFYETVGTAPNQQFIVQFQDKSMWPSPSSDETITFQIVIDEATNEIWTIFSDSEFGGSDAANDNGATATIGLAGPNQDLQTSYNNADYLSNNSCVHYFYTNCPAPSNVTVVYTTTDEAQLTWSAGLASEGNWTVIYGPAGFDPATGGTSLPVTSSTVTIPGLNDLTDYDVYVFADCTPSLQSPNGAFGTFTTLPNCADVTGITTATAVDSLFSSWSWTESAPAYPSTGFNLQYGFTGFGLYDGTHTIVNADNDVTDTTENAAFIGGGVYDLYVQSVCNTDTSTWVGPVQFTMPLTNDSTCFAEALMVDSSLYVFNNSGATVDAGETAIAPPGNGCNVTDGWCNSNLNFTTWFTFTAPASGDIDINASDVGFDGQLAVYEATDCGDFATYTLLGANDDGGNGAAPYVTICGLTPGNTYYVMFDSYSTTTTGQYSLRLSEIVLEAGTSNGVINVCTGDTVNLYNGITGNDAGGAWSEAVSTANFNDPLFPSNGLAYQMFDFEYRVTQGCAYDSIVQQVQIYGPSSAGTDGTIAACLNQPVDLLSGLGGNVDLGGTWYDPQNTVTPSAINAPAIQGQFNYDYIAGNGVCPNDTANVILDVVGTCDYLNIETLVFENMTMFPNPTNGSIFITNNGSSEVFNYELTDVNGKVISAQTAAINGTETTEVNLEQLETGFYLIRVFNDNAEKTFRIIKE